MNYSLTKLPPSRFLTEYPNMEYVSLDIVGSVKEYKTGTIWQLLWFLDDVKKAKKVFVGDYDISFLPKELNCHVVPSILDIPTHCYAILDDMSFKFPSRKKDITIQQVVSLLGQKHIKPIQSSQTKQNKDVAWERDIVTIDIHKYMDPHSIMQERPEFQLRSWIANAKITEIANHWGIWRGFLSYVPYYGEVLYLPDPCPIYDERLSHALMNVDLRKAVA